MEQTVTEKQISLGGLYRHVGEDVRVISKHSDQACVIGPDSGLFYVPYDQLKPQKEVR